jgi:hypothetical protein
MASVMKDPRMDAASDMPFDGKHMIFGGFAPVVDLPDWQDRPNRIPAAIRCGRYSLSAASPQVTTSGRSLV